MQSTYCIGDQLPPFDPLTKILNALQTEPLLLRMCSRKHSAYNNCCRDMSQAYVGQLPNGTVRTGACNRRTACKIQQKSFAVYSEYTAVYFEYTAVYSEVYGRILVVYGTH